METSDDFWGKVVGGRGDFDVPEVDALLVDRKVVS